jgi:hypothetical protein
MPPNSQDVVGGMRIAMGHLSTLTTIKIRRCLCCGFNATSLKYRVNYLLGDGAKPPVLTASLLQTDVRGGRLRCPLQVGDRKETTSGLGTYCRFID